MVKSVEGIYRNGKVELIEPALQLEDGRVLVTFLPTPEVSLEARRIGPTQAADLRVRLSTFAEDWNRPEMNVYDEL